MPSALRLCSVLLAAAALSCAEGAPVRAEARGETRPEPPAPAQPAPPALQDESAAAAEREALARWLDGCQVRPDDYVRGKVYTWTRAEQVEALRRPRQRLLSRARSAEGVAAAFDQSLVGEAEPLARFLRTRRTTRRFAWVAPWATRMGWESGDYGDRLIAIELRDGAWVARFFPDAESEAERWQVRDSDGAIVSPERVRASPERVGFVYHAGSGEAADGTRRRFREFVVVNEDQVQEFALGTPEIAARLERDAAHLERLAAYFEGPRVQEPRPGDVAALSEAVARSWSAAGAAEEVGERYLGCLALAGTEYVPEPATLRAIARALRGLPAEAPLRRQVRRRAVRVAPPTPSNLPGPGVW